MKYYWRDEMKRNGMGMSHGVGIEECAQRFDWETWRKQANWKT